MTKDVYKSSRIYYIIEETAHYLITILISGAYFARLASSFGFSDSLVALLSSFVNLGCIFQLLAIAMFKQSRVKRKVTLLFTLSHLSFMFLYIVPFFNINPFVKATMFIAFRLGGYFLFNTASSPHTNWFMALVPDKSRGRFTALKEGISLIFGIIFRFTMGLLIDRYDAIGNTAASFTVCGITIFVLMIIHALSLIFSKEKEAEIMAENHSDGILSIICDKKILPIFLLSILWAISYGISTPFLGTYQIKELGFSLTFIAWLSVINAGVRITASVFLGKYADRNSFAKMLKICYIFVCISFLALMFTSPPTGYILYPVYEIFMAAAMGGINSAEINIVFDYVTPEKRKNTLAVKQTVYGLCGFFATLLATPLVNCIQSSGNSFLGIHLYAQQFLSVISLVCVIVMIMYIDKIMVMLKPLKDYN